MNLTRTNVQTLRRCPKCGRITDSVSCCFVKGPPLIPQMDDYTVTEPCEVVAVDVLRSAEPVREALAVFDNPPDMCPREIRMGAAIDAAIRVASTGSQRDA